jgi:hypothetical protein
MHAISSVIYVTGLIAWTFGNLMFLAVVFRYSTAWLFACMLIPGVDWIYFFLYSKQTWKPMLIGTAGFVMTLIGHWIGSGISS